MTEMTETRVAPVDSTNPRRAVPAARFHGLVTTATGDEVLVYDKERHHIHHLNRTSAIVWRLCDGQRSVEEIALLASTEADAEVDVSTIRLALSKLSGAYLLAQPLEDGMSVRSQSRRVFMKRAAVAGAIAVPAIVSMSAPALAAASGLCGSGCTCNSNCNTGPCSVCSQLDGMTCCNPTEGQGPNPCTGGSGNNGISC